MNKTLKRKLEVNILPPIFVLFLWLLYLTCTKRYHFDASKKITTPMIFALWHGELMMGLFAYKGYKKSKDADVIISKHHDGELISRVVKIFGGGVLRGSSSKGGLFVLKAGLKSIKKGRDIGITPDGPKGPRHSVANGVAVLAQKMSVPIVAANIKASRAWRMNSWDQFAIPKPFSRLDFYYSDPFYVHDMSLEEAKTTIHERLMRNAF